MKTFYTLLFLLFALQACTTTTKPGSNSRLGRVSWIANNWEMQVPAGTMTEVWKQQSDSAWTGTGLLVSSDGDTLFKEELRIISKNDTLYYLPTVANQNEGKEVSFKEKELTDNKVVFENLSHDFPQRIIYEKTSDTSILAYIEGIKDGKTVRQDFPYTKAK